MCRNLLGSYFLGSLSTHLSVSLPLLGVLTSRRNVEAVELSFTNHLALELPLSFLRRVTGEWLVWGRGGLDEGPNHCDFQLVTYS